MTSDNVVLKRVYSIGGILFLGALGSGLWELFLKDFIFSISNFFVGIVSNFYSGYIDTMYKYVGVAQWFDSFYIFFNVFLFLFPISLILFFWIKSRAKKYSNKLIYESSHNNVENISKSIDKSLRHTIKILNAAIGFSSIVCMVTCFDSIVKYNSNTNAQNYIERTLEIIRPSVGETEYIVLRSEFRQVDSRDKFVHLLNKIKQSAETNNIKLPEGSFYGVDN